MTLIYPMFAMVVLTFVMMFVLGGSRLYSVWKREVHPSYYQLFSGEGIPEYVLKPSRNFSNLLEVPVLFYLVCLLAIVLKLESASLLALAWVFVALRCIHSIIHMTYNNPLHRLLVFAVSSLLVLVMWIELMLKL